MKTIHQRDKVEIKISEEVATINRSSSIMKTMVIATVEVGESMTDVKEIENKNIRTEMITENKKTNIQLDNLKCDTKTTKMRFNEDQLKQTNGENLSKEKVT